MRRIRSGLLVVLMVFALCSCGKTNQNMGGAVTVKIKNMVVNKITTLAASWSIDGKTIGTTGVEIAGDGGCLGEDYFSFPVYAEDIENEKDLQKLAITIKVTEKDGGPLMLQRFLFRQNGGINTSWNSGLRMDVLIAAEEES